MDSINYKPRLIKIIIAMGTGVMGDGDPTKSTTYTLTDHRVTAEIDAYGGATQGAAYVKIFGLQQSMMNALTSIGPVQVQVMGKNSIQILAGDDAKTLSTIYYGTIIQAYADYNNAPDVSLDITATSAVIAAMGVATAYHNAGKTKVSEIMNWMAQQLKWEFVNADIGVNGGQEEYITDPSFNGSYWDQIQACAKAANQVVAVQGTENTTSVLKIKHTYSSFVDPAIVVSPKINMIGYPIYSSKGITVKTLFLPEVNLGSPIIIRDSIVTPANGKWIVNNVKHELESMMPNGKWQTTCGVFPNGLTT